MATKNDRPTKADRRDAARAEALRLREEQQKRERRNRVVAISGLAAAFVVLVVAVVMILGKDTKPIAYAGTEELSLGEVVAPSTANEAGGIPVGPDLVAGSTAEEPAVTIEIVYDYQCPHCGDFESAQAENIRSLLQSGNVQLVFRPVSFMDYVSGKKQYSTRASNAAAVVADLAPEKFLDFHEALFRNQPGAQGLNDDKIAAIAREAGVPEDVIARFTDPGVETTERKFSRWIAAATEHTSNELGGLSTPTVLIDGEKWPGPDMAATSVMDPVALAEAVAAKKAELGLD